MLPAERQQRILDLLQNQGMVSIANLSELFQVSEMTIHRDLERLAADGLLRKVRGGAVPFIWTSPQAESNDTAVSNLCLICQKKTRRQTQVILHLANGRQQTACCPHCGLMRLAHHDTAVVSVLVTDFLYGRTIAASSAHYLIDPDITICCLPTTLAFACHEDARRFQTGFGGEIHTLSSAMAYIQTAVRIRSEV